MWTRRDLPYEQCEPCRDLPYKQCEPCRDLAHITLKNEGCFDPVLHRIEQEVLTFYHRVFTWDWKILDRSSL